MRLCLFILSLLLVNCRPALAADTDGATPQDVTFCQLAKDPSAFYGRRIRIRAIYNYMFEIQHLESPACCPDRMGEIWVEIEAGLERDSQRQFNKFPKGMGVVLATFVGTFEGGGNGYGPFAERYRLTVDQIEKVERTARSSSKQDNPAWVPKNCETSDSPPVKQSSSTVMDETLRADASRATPEKQEASGSYAHDALEQTAGMIRGRNPSPTTR